MELHACMGMHSIGSGDGEDCMNRMKYCRRGKIR